MSKRKNEQMLEEVRRLVQSFEEDDESLGAEERRIHLRETGINPDELRARLHEAAKKLAKRELLANRSVSQLLKRAINTTRPDDQLPQDTSAARSFAGRWLDKFTSDFVLPSDFQVCRSYRKSDDLSDVDRAELDRLEEEWKLRVKRENERQT